MPATVDRRDPAHAGQAVYTRGFLHNRDDAAPGLDAALARVFPDRTVRVHGSVALFSARRG